VANFSFSTPVGNCWITQGIAPGLYLVQLKILYSDGTTGAFLKKVVVTR
jgi:hypothetical protein